MAEKKRLEEEEMLRRQEEAEKQREVRSFNVSEIKEEGDEREEGLEKEERKTGQGENMTDNQNTQGMRFSQLVEQSKITSNNEEVKAEED